MPTYIVGTPGNDVIFFSTMSFTTAGRSKRGSANPKEREQYLRDFCRGIFRTAPPADIGEAVLRSALQAPAGVADQLLAQPYPRTYWRDIVAGQQVPVLYVIRPRLREQGEALLAGKGWQRAQVEVFDDAGHALFVDAASRFNALTADFARRAFSLPANAERPAANGHPRSSGNLRQTAARAATLRPGRPRPVRAGRCS